MDIDFDDLDTLGLEQDKIKVFLQTKLIEVLEENKKLDIAITERKQHLQPTVKKPEAEATVELLWKKVFGNKFCLGYSVKISSDVIGEKLYAFLYWNWKSHFAYTMSMYTKEMHSFNNENHKVQDLKYITVAFEIPTFTQTSVYEISGTLYLEEDSSIPFPDIKIAVSDCTDRKMLEWTIADNIMSLLTEMSCSKIRDVIFVLPTTWQCTVHNAFEIYCGFRKLNVEIKDRVYYVADKVSTVFDNSVIELLMNSEGQTHISGVIYCANEQAFNTMLHHVMNSVKGFHIYPIDVNNLLFPDISLENCDYLERFKNCVMKELQLRENLLRRPERSLASLINLENKVNVLYLKLKREREILYEVQ